MTDQTNEDKLRAAERESITQLLQAWRSSVGDVSDSRARTDAENVVNRILALPRGERDLEPGELRNCGCGGAPKRVTIEDGGQCIECARCGVTTRLHYDRCESLESDWNEAMRSRSLSDPAETQRVALEAYEWCASEARRYAESYPQSSDGRNTFLLLAENIDRRALITHQEPDAP